MARSKYWIQNAVKRPGALKAWLRRHEDEIEEATGMKPFTRTGEVNTNALRKLRNTEYYQRLSTKTKQRINFAITAEGFRPDRKTKKSSKRRKKRSRKRRKR